ncbi:heavy-metal-associated domain-containing protein [Pseudomonas aeruginosa]|uniref:heavy-metal-associated domain-containing protein n=1 Tax=Pseudomonas aeruginosa TaxID=287 RepID=UPI00235A281E|nr:heavy-metal-associated domain-containing protein [Pseudomonas aeruginosa]
MFSLNVSGMGCGSCVSKITKAIQTLDHDARVEVDRAAGKVTVESTESAESIRELIQELGYAALVCA